MACAIILSAFSIVTTNQAFGCITRHVSVLTRFDLRSGFPLHPASHDYPTDIDVHRFSIYRLHHEARYPARSHSESMSRLKPETAWQRVVEDRRLSGKVRIAALQQILRPSLSLLRRLLKAGASPPKLRLLACEKYQVEMLVRKAANAGVQEGSTAADC
jgi:hypothetical protein